MATGKVRPAEEASGRLDRGWLGAVLFGLTLAACSSGSAGPSEPDPAADPSSIAFQIPTLTGEVGTSQTVSVRVTDDTGKGIPGVPVSWSVTAGSVETGQTASGDDGLASTNWTFGSTAGPQEITATVSGIPPSTLVATATPSAAVRISITTDSLRFLSAGETERVEVEDAADQYGNSVSISGLTWSSSNEAVVTVDQGGEIMSTGRGMAYVRAAAGSARDSVAVYVIPYGVFTITLDDGFESTYSGAYPILKSLGLRANAAVNPGPIDLGWTGYLTLGQVQELAGAGWSIVSHSMTHPHLTKVSDADLEKELADSRTWIEQRGFPGGNIFVIPYHDWDSRVMAAIQRNYDVARGISANPPWPLEFQPWPPSDPYRLTGIDADVEDQSFRTAAGRKGIVAAIERVIDRGEIVDLFFHAVAPADEAAFRELMEVVATHKEQFRVYHELFPN